ncbi:MAG: Eco57I restriction-modification methylase domain-containing protein, partial [Rubrobacter sp.]
VLDPACGSGAFLFAALNVLEPLYEACLERMQRFVEAAEDERSFRDFREILAEMKTHPNPRYFVLKSIIVDNLYGVDVMEEAVEIARLRLFLKLMGQLEHAEEIEPLPDIDFNIRAGNTLVGFASFAEFREYRKRKLGIDDRAAERIEAGGAEAGAAFGRFREMQVEGGADSEDFRRAKADLRGRLEDLEAELDRYLALQWGVGEDDEEGLQAWRVSHRPFHWCVDFYGIMESGGFDAIVGNPPYVVYNPEKVGYKVEPIGYATLPTKNLYAFMFERSLALAKPCSPVGLIVQLTSVSGQKLPPLQDLLLSRTGLRALPFPRRPESVFDGVEMPVAILLSLPEHAREPTEDSAGSFVTSGVQRFYTQERPHAFELVSLARHRVRLQGHRIAKIGSAGEVG